VINLNPDDFIELGKKIITDENYLDEPRFRTGINRIYFGTLHILQRVKQIHVENTKRYHSEIVNKLKAIDIRLGNLVGNLKELREDSDYSLNNLITLSSVDEAISTYERILKHVNYY
jgi:hypothetical protein